MEAKVRKKSDGDGEGRGNHAKQYTRNLQRIFHNESNFKFRQLEDFDEDKELLSPTESEPEDLLGLGNLEFVSFATDTRDPCPNVVHLPCSGSRRLIGDLSLNIPPIREKSEELIIIDNDVEAPVPEPVVAASKPVPVKPLTRIAQRHISESPYKGSARAKSMSPEGKEYCPNNWFEVDKEVTQEGFCQQLSWKCCFVCVCLPVCYPCYFTRTVRKSKKEADKLTFEDGGLISAGQQEVHSTLSSKRSTLHSKCSTIHSKQRENKDASSPPENTRENYKVAQSETETVNINVIILQSRSAELLIRDLKERKLLHKSDSVSSIDGSEGANQKRSVIKNFFQQKQTSVIEPTINEECDDKESPESPVVLRKFLNDHMSTIPSRSKKTVKTKASNLTQKDKEGNASEVFYSLESNLDQKSFPRPPVLSRPGDIPDTHLSSLPSMTSGRFYSANSSVFSGVSSPRSDLSPSKETEWKTDEKQHIEPVVEIVEPVKNEVTISSVPCGDCEEKRRSLPTNNNNNVQEPEFERKNTVSSFRESKMRKSLSLSSNYSSLTKVSLSNEDLPLEHKSRRSKDEKKSNSLQTKTTKKGLKVPVQKSRHRLTLSSSRNQKLELKYLGSTGQSIASCQQLSEHFFEEGKLSSWSTKDIHDIVSKDLPRMDVVVLVVNQTEKKQIEQILSRPTGVVGYIREYWSGFFPLLLIEISDETEDEMISKKSILSIHSLFSVTHRIIVDPDEKNFIFESVGRFYNHIKVFHCEKFQQSLHTKKLGHLVSLSLTERFWFCSGLCQMRVTKKKERNDEAKKSRFLKTVRQTIYRTRLVSDAPSKSEEDQ